MEALWTFIGIVALIAIIFGISMTDAFWGIIIFVIISVLLAVAFVLFGSGALKFWNWFTNVPTPAPKPKVTPVVRQAKIVKKKKHPVASAIFFHVMIVAFIYFVSALFIMCIAAIANWKIDRMPLWLMTILPALPVVAFYLVSIIKWVITKKHAGHKSKRA